MTDAMLADVASQPPGMSPMEHSRCLAMAFVAGHDALNTVVRLYQPVATNLTPNPYGDIVPFVCLEAETPPRSRSIGLDPLSVHERFVADHLDQDRSMTAVPNPAPYALATQRQRGLELLVGSEHDIGLKRKRRRPRRRQTHERRTELATNGSEPRPESTHPVRQVDRARAVGVAKVSVAHLDLLRKGYCTKVQYYPQALEPDV